MKPLRPAGPRFGILAFATAVVLPRSLTAADGAKVNDAGTAIDFATVDFAQLARVKIVPATRREIGFFSLPFMAVGVSGADREHQLPRTRRAGWQPQKSFRLTAAPENLTNDDYRINSSGLNEPERSRVLCAAVKF